MNKKERIPEKKTLLLLLVLLLTALTVRIVYIRQLSTNPFFHHPIVDSDTYDKMARKIAVGKDPSPGAPFFQPPLYPYFLGLLYALVGRALGWVRFLQMLLGVANVLLTFRLGERLFGRRIGFAAGLVAALYGTMLFFEGELLAPVLIIFLNLLLILSLLRVLERPVWNRALTAGLFLGASAITMAVVLPFAPVFLLYAAIVFRTRKEPVPWRTIAGVGGFLLLGTAVIIAPVTIRNRLEGHDAVLISTNGGINFYIGTGKNFDKKVGIRPGYKWQTLGQEPMLLGYKKPSEQSAYFTEKAKRLILEDPLGYGKILAQKLHLFAHGNEIMRNQEIYPFRQYSSLLALLVWKHGLAFPFGLLFPLAVVGAALALVRKDERPLLLVLFIACHILVLLLFFISARYRMNVLPFLIILAVSGVAGIIRLCRGKRWGKVGLTAGSLAILMVLSNWKVGAMPAEYNADAYYNLGVQTMDEGKNKEAKALFEKAIALEPDYPEANGNLGILLHQEGDLKRARACFELVLRQYPDDSEANINMGIILYGEGDIEGAKKQFRKVLARQPKNEIALNNLKVLEKGAAEGKEREIPPQFARLLFDLKADPDNPALLTNLGAAYLAREDYKNALEPLQKAVRLAPMLAQAHNNLGIALANLNREEEARSEFLKALQIDPGNLSAKNNLEMLKQGKR
jgi:Flp pilus assembly protein TadD/4-amino-4-deoxy-L-arabinose transferase-like glycosyltransferase